MRDKDMIKDRDKDKDDRKSTRSDDIKEER